MKTKFHNVSYPEGTTLSFFGYDVVLKKEIGTRPPASLVLYGLAGIKRQKEQLWNAD
jgi:hypothetical protein